MQVVLCGNTSPSIEPFRANAYTQKTKSGSHLHKNKYLEKVLETYGENTLKCGKVLLLIKVVFNI